MQAACTRHDQPAYKTAEHNADDDDHDCRDDTRDVAHQLAEHVRQRLQSQRIRCDEHHREHDEPEHEVCTDSCRVHVRARALDGVHNTAALEQLIEANSSENFLRALFEEAGK